MDGVLAPLAATPDAVAPDPRRTAVLLGLATRLDGRVAIISGRTIAEIDRIAESASVSASRVHGLERRRADGSPDHAAPAPNGGEPAGAFDRVERALQVAGVVDRVERTEDVHAVLGGLLHEPLDHPVLVVAIAEEVLPT